MGLERDDEGRRKKKKQKKKKRACQGAPSQCQMVPSWEVPAPMAKATPKKKPNVAPKPKVAAKRPAAAVAAVAAAASKKPAAAPAAVAPVSKKLAAAAAAAAEPDDDDSQEMGEEEQPREVDKEVEVGQGEPEPTITGAGPVKMAGEFKLRVNRRACENLSIIQYRGPEDKNWKQLLQFSDKQFEDNTSGGRSPRQQADFAVQDLMPPEVLFGHLLSFCSGRS